MSVYTRSWLGLGVLFLLFAFIWLGIVPQWWAETQPSLPIIFGIMVALLLAFNGAWFLYIRQIRCPNCGIRFGPKMYRQGLVSTPWPRRHCWNCGVDIRNAEQRVRMGLAIEQPSRTARPVNGFPLSIRGIIVFTVIWNVLCLADRVAQGSFFAPPGPLTLLPLVFAFGLSWKLKTSAPLQRFFLREGHSVAEIRELVFLIQLITGAMIIIFPIVLIGTAVSWP